MSIKKLWILLLISSSCFNQKPTKKIDYSDTKDFNELLYKEILNDKPFQKGIHLKYKKLCQTCHGYFAEGRVGPNLTDNYWINGEGSIQDIYKILKYGISNKGMRSYKNVLSDKELIAMSHYLKQLKGSSPQGAKAPQGHLID
jgi:cytochrome c oxidase cbb3-type subunit 3